MLDNILELGEGDHIIIAILLLVFFISLYMIFRMIMIAKSKTKDYYKEWLIDNYSEKKRK
jgi:hypothetical protein